MYYIRQIRNRFDRQEVIFLAKGAPIARDRKWVNTPIAAESYKTADAAKLAAYDILVEGRHRTEVVFMK